MRAFFNHNYQSKNNDLESIGFATFPCLEEDEIAALKSLYKLNTSDKFNGFHPTMFHNDKAYREKMNDGICKLLQTKLSFIVSLDYKILYGNFMVKEPGKDSVMKIHQDWTYVNEVEHRSFAIWIPLVDLNESNGAFTVVPYSHTLTKNKRGPGTFCPFYEHSDKIIEKYSVPLYLKAGEAVCWDHKLAHLSPANLSEIARIAVTVILIPKGVPIFHYFKADNKQTLETYQVDNTFFMHYVIRERPKLLLLEEVDYNPEHLSLEEIISSQKSN